MPLPRIESGKRCLIAGRTGSGKTTLGAWFLVRSYQHWLILNPKHTPLYRQLPYSVVHKEFDAKKILADLKRYRFVVFEPSGEQADALYMDGIIEWLQAAQSNVGLCADELYTLHMGGGRAGPGLIGWLTRGREPKQSFVGLTQRPAWLSLFLFTESDLICEMDLTLDDDRDKMYKFTGDSHFLERVQNHRWLCYDVQAAQTTLYAPVPKLKLKENADG